MTDESHFVAMTVVVQDPDTTVGNTRNPLTAKLQVPVDRLSPGPRGHRFHVVDLDLAEGTASPPADLTDDEDGWEYRDQFAGRALSRRKALNDHTFHAQNVYAIAARTLATFERVLGRRVPWAFSSPVLSLVPRALAEANAYYSRDDQAVLFGYIPGRTQDHRVLTCLSHDIVAHEVTHGVLDGLRPRFVEPGLPDQAAFHEALADIVALLSVLSVQKLVDHILPESKAGSDRIESRSTRSTTLISSRTRCSDWLRSSDEASTTGGHKHCAARSTTSS